MVYGALGSPGTLSKDHMGQNYFNNNTKKLFTFFFFYHIDIYTDGTKAVVVKLLAQIKAVVPSVLVAIVIFTNMH